MFNRNFLMVTPQHFDYRNMTRELNYLCTQPKIYHKNQLTSEVLKSLAASEVLKLIQT